LSLIKEGGTIDIKIDKILDDNYRVAYKLPGLITDRSIQSHIENMIKNNKDSYADSVVKNAIKKFKKEIIDNLLNSVDKEFEALANICVCSPSTKEAFQLFSRGIQSNRDK
jgi:hypothetical protein